MKETVEYKYIEMYYSTVIRSSNGILFVCLAINIGFLKFKVTYLLKKIMIKLNHYRRTVKDI